MDNSEYIDFEKEIQEFIDKQYVSKVTILEKNPNFWKFRIISLENHEFEVECSVAQGIQVYF